MLELTNALWQFIQSNSYLAIFVLILIEDCGVPLLFLPGEVLLTWAGYQCSAGNLDLGPLLMITVLASTVGATVLYGASFRVGSQLLVTFARWTHIDLKLVQRGQGFMRRHGVLAVVIGRLIPGARVPTSLISGVARVPYQNFLPATVFSAVLWTLGYALSGSVLGAAWSYLGDHLFGYFAVHRALDDMVALVVLLSASAGIVRVVLTRFPGPWRPRAWWRRRHA